MNSTAVNCPACGVTFPIEDVTRALRDDLPYDHGCSCSMQVTISFGSGQPTVMSISGASMGGVGN